MAGAPTLDFAFQRAIQEFDVVARRVEPLVLKKNIARFPRPLLN